MSKVSIYNVTLFPNLFEPFINSTILEKFFSKDDVEFNQIYLGDCSPKKFKGVDAPPYGGGAGMVMRADVLKVALEKAFFHHKPEGNFSTDFKKNFKVIYTAPRGVVWNAKEARSFAKNNFNPENKNIVFICGRYEGIDERFIEKYVDEVYSLGDYVLMGGELAVLIMLESSARFVKGILGHEDSASGDSFEKPSLEYPQYTRPQKFEEEEVPAVLISGDHKKIITYRLEESQKMTEKYRPDLLKKK